MSEIEGIKERILARGYIGYEETLLSSLEKFEKQEHIVRCEYDHHYLYDDTGCPWCKIERVRLELKQADALREIRNGQLEELKVALEKEKEKVRDLELGLKHNLTDKINIQRYAEERIKELEELVAIQNDTITNSEKRIDEAEFLRDGMQTRCGELFIENEKLKEDTAFYKKSLCEEMTHSQTAEERVKEMKEIERLNKDTIMMLFDSVEKLKSNLQKSMEAVKELLAYGPIFPHHIQESLEKVLEEVSK